MSLRGGSRVEGLPDELTEVGDVAPVGGLCLEASAKQPDGHKLKFCEVGLIVASETRR